MGDAGGRACNWGTARCSVRGNHPASTRHSTTSRTAGFGCVYNVRGFEFDYVGVIVGSDLVYRPMDGGWVGQRDHRSRAESARAAERESVYEVAAALW